MKCLKKLGRNSSFGHIENYLVAALAVVATGCTENLGVVPLFFISAFLFEPAFFFFLNLLFSVTHVLETIGELLYNYLDQLRSNNNKYNLFLRFNYKPYFLPRNVVCVKGIFALCLILATLNPLKAQENANSDVILSKGQSISIELPHMIKFNIGNKEVLTYKFDEKTKTLMLRGKTMGTSELIIWNKDQSIEKKQIYVISKAQELKNLNIAQILSRLGLEVRPGLPHIEVSGVIKTINQLAQFKKIQKQYREHILDQTTLSNEAQKEIMAEIYKLLLTEYKETIRCKVENSDVNCLYPVNEKPSSGVMKYLQQKYSVAFLEINNQKLTSNYSFRLKLIQLEQLDGLELRLGLDELRTTLGELINVPLRTIIERNSFVLAEKKVVLNTLAEPTGLIRPMNPAEFSIGADVPYVIKGREGVEQTAWQFAGLKVKINLENIGERLMVRYETELTKPDATENGSISGNKEKSSVIIDLKRPLKLFQITLRTNGNSIDQMPFISSIPILGELFKSKGKQSNYKTITAIMEIRENE